jgi:hypothetical protein
VFAMTARGLRMCRSMRPNYSPSTAGEVSPGTAKSAPRARRLSSRPSEISDVSCISAYSGASAGLDGGSPAQRQTIAGGEALRNGAQASEASRRGTVSMDAKRAAPSLGIKHSLASGTYKMGSSGRVSM